LIHYSSLKNDLTSKKIEQFTNIIDVSSLNYIHKRMVPSTEEDNKPK